MNNKNGFISSEPISDKPSRRSKIVTKVSEDFRLTKAEKADLYLLSKKYKERGTRGFYRGAYWERILAVICIYLLKRDNRISVYTINKGYYDEVYEFNKSDFKNFEKRVLGVLESVMNETFPYCVLKR